MVLLLAWILARNLIEGVLEPPYQLGFDWREAVSFPMVFLHFPLYYLALFGGVVLWVHLLTRRSLARVSGAIAAGFVVLLVAPIADALASGGRGYDLGYLLGFGSVLWRFWDPTAAVASVSPGQRMEIVLGCLLLAAYVLVLARARGWSAARALPVVLASAAGLFLWAAFLGAWPSLLAWVAYPARGIEAAYLEAYRGFGLVSDESRRHALALAVLLLPVAALFVWRLDPRAFRAHLRAMPWSRLAHYTGLAPAGAYLGWLVYREHMPAAFANPLDWVAVLVVWSALVGAFLAALWWNQRWDEKADRLNRHRSPLVEGGIDPAALARAAWGAAAAALLLALLVSYQAFLLMIPCLILCRLYSAPPVRLKRWPLVATLTLGVLSLISCTIGFSLFGQEMTPRVFPSRVAWLLVAGITLGFTAKDLKDADGDRRTGVVTLATLLGPRWGRGVIGVLVVAGYALAPLCLPLGSVYLLLTGLAAAISLWLLWRRPRPDTALLQVYLVFAVVTLAALTLAPEQTTLRRLSSAGFGGPSGAVELHASVRLLEERTRLFRMQRDDEPVPAALPDGQALVGQEAGRMLEQMVGPLPRGEDERPPQAATRDAVGQAADEPWRERLSWIQAQANPADDRGVDARLAWLMERRPLCAAYRERALARAVERGRYEDALALATAGLELGVRPGDFLRHRVAAAVAMGRARGRWDPERLRDELRGARRFGSEPIALEVLSGDMAASLGETAQALDHYWRALDHDPEHAEAWAGLGETLHARGDRVGAVAALEKAARLAPQDPWILNNLGVARRDAGQLFEALTPLRQAQRLAPEMFEPAFNLAVVYARMGQWDRAREQLQRAHAIRPGFPGVERALQDLRFLLLGPPPDEPPSGRDG